MAINNTVTSTNPFLSGTSGLLKPPSTSGTTTSQFAPTNTTTTSVPGKTTFNAPVPTSIPLGSVASSTAPASSGGLVSTPTTYQQNLSKYNLTSLPAGYSFNASGALTNNAGQEYTNPTVTSPTNNSPASATPISPMAQASGVQNMQSPTNPNQATPSTFANAVGTLAQTASQTNPAYDQAVKDYQQAQQALQQSRTQEANALALNAENPIPLEFQQGRGQVLQTQYLSQQEALAQQMAAAQGLGQIGTAQQGTQQTGLGQAAGLVSPTLGQYGQTQYSPLGGTVGGGTGAGVSQSDPFYQTMQTYAQALASGQGTAIPSSITGNPALQAQLLQMAKQINPNFNYNQAIATGASQQAQTGQAQQYQSASQQAQNLGLQLNQVIQNTGVNPSDLNAANVALQKIASNTSNPNYATFQNLITDLANTYAQVLTPAGGSTTDMVRQISGSLLDSSMKGTGISQVMQNLDAQVQAKIAGVPTAYGTTNTNTTSGSAPAGWF